MRTATWLLVVLGASALLGVGYLALRGEGARGTSMRPRSRAAEESAAPRSEPLLEPEGAASTPEESIPEAASPLGGARGEDAGTDEPGPRSSLEAALLFRVADARSAQPLETFEVRVGRSFLRPLLDQQGRIRHEFPEGRVSFPGLIEGRAGESVQLVILARGYRELRIPDVYVPPGGELDLGTLRLERVPRVTVQVLDELTDEPVAGARVSLLAAGSVPAPEERPALPAALDPWSARTDAAGCVLLTSRPGETVTLSVRHPQHQSLDAELLLPLSEEHRETVRLKAAAK